MKNRPAFMNSLRIANVSNRQLVDATNNVEGIKEVLGMSEFCSAINIQKMEKQATQSFQEEYYGTIIESNLKCSCLGFSDVVNLENKSDPDLILNCDLMYKDGIKRYKYQEAVIYSTLNIDRLYAVVTRMSWCEEEEGNSESSHHCENFDYCAIDNEVKAPPQKEMVMCSCGSTADYCTTCDVCPGGEHVAIDCTATTIDHYDYYSDCDGSYTGTMLAKIRIPRILQKSSSSPTPLPTTDVPTQEPTTVLPTKQPTATPTKQPTATPSKQPTATPTKQPTAIPTKQPIVTPTKQPTATPTKQPTVTPTKQPTVTPTSKPTVEESLSEESLSEESLSEESLSEESLSEESLSEESLSEESLSEESSDESSDESPSLDEISITFSPTFSPDDQLLLMYNQTNSSDISSQQQNETIQEELRFVRASKGGAISGSILTTLLLITSIYLCVLFRRKRQQIASEQAMNETNKKNRSKIGEDGKVFTMGENDLGFSVSSSLSSSNSSGGSASSADAVSVGAASSGLSSYETTPSRMQSIKTMVTDGENVEMNLNPYEEGEIKKIKRKFFRTNPGNRSSPQRIPMW